MASIEEYSQLMFERNKIYYKKEVLKQEPPWTDNVYFQKRRFTNVYRYLDKHSQFAINNIIKSDLSIKDVIYHLCYFRLFCSIQNYEKYKNNIYDLDYIDKALHEDLENNGCKELVSTRFLCQQRVMTCKRFITFVTTKYLKNVQEHLDELVNINTAPELFKCLTKTCQMSKFVANEVVLDLSYIARFNLRSDYKLSLEDHIFFSTGVVKALNSLYDLSYASSAFNQDLLNHLYKTKELVAEYCNNHKDECYFLEYDGKSVKEIKENNLLISDIEMWLCEYHKYIHNTAYYYR